MTVDTVLMDIEDTKVRVRLLDIDTPKKYENQKLHRDAARCGISVERIFRLDREATAFAKSLIHI